MSDKAAFLTHLTETLADIEAEGLFKRERMITSAQGAHVKVAGRDMLNLCANNYLGLADDPRLVDAAKAAMDGHGYGMASVRHAGSAPHPGKPLCPVSGQGRFHSVRRLL